MSSGFTVALRELSAAQKPPKGVSLYSRYVNRPAGRLLAAAGHVAGLTPNQVTLISSALSCCGIVLVALCRPGWPMAVGAGAALVLGFATDAADGQLARLRGGGSAVGEWLDHVTDCGKTVALHAAVLISFYRFFPGSRGWLLVPLGFQLCAVLTFFAGVLTVQLVRGAGRSAAGAGSASSRARAVALLPADHGVLCCCFVLLGAPEAFRWAYTALAAANLAFAAALLAKWFREVRAV